MPRLVIKGSIRACAAWILETGSWDVSGCWTIDGLWNAGGDDTDPPTHGVSRWTVGGEPHAISDTEIRMTAAAGLDATTPIEYKFTWKSGAGGSDSEWQTSTTYTDSGLTPETEYSYTVTTRDSVVPPNVGAESTAEFATTETTE